MEDIAIKLGFVLVIVALIAVSWRADLARAAVWRMGSPIRRVMVRPSRPGHASTTLRIERASEGRKGGVRWNR
jgi:hypothetical protein